MRHTATMAARYLARSTELLACILMIVVTGLNLFQVAGRYLFGMGFG